MVKARDRELGHEWSNDPTVAAIHPKGSCYSFGNVCCIHTDDDGTAPCCRCGAVYAWEHKD